MADLNAITHNAYEKAHDRFMEAGFEAVFKKAFNEWNGKYHAEKPFEEWREAAVMAVPSWMSMDDFFAMYDEELRAEYEEATSDD